MAARLVLFPSSLQTTPDKSRFAPIWFEALEGITGFVVENVRTSRRFLRALDPTFPIDNHQWIAQEADGSWRLHELQAGWKEGQAWGLLSEAGYPGVGDPGAEIVSLAHRLGVQVEVLPGSCSFLMALAASGLGGQHFVFRGYVPIEEGARKSTLKAWEQESRRAAQTQICMDTPYRNSALFAALLQELSPHTRLCMAQDLEGEHETIYTQTVAAWKASGKEPLNKVPCVFLFVAN